MRPPPNQPSPDQLFSAAAAHYQSGQWLQASSLCRQILTEQPDYAPALHLMGLLARRSAQNDLSTSCFQSAAQAFTKHTLLHPDSPQPWLGLAASLRELNHLADAIVAYQHAITLQPQLPRPVHRPHVELAHLLLQSGQTNQAIDHYRKAVHLAPTDLDAHNSLASALTAAEQFPQAEQAFQTALALDPRSAPVWNNLGNLYRLQAKMDHAIAAYHHATTSQPPLSAAFSNLGNLLKDQGKLQQAITSLRRAVELDPTSPAIHSNLAYAACFDPDHTAEQILTEAAQWADKFETPLLQAHATHQNDRNPHRRLRIGYVSPDFRNHVVGRNVLPIFQHHDRAQFEIHLFSTLTVHDPQTADFIRAADHWHECAPLSDAQLADKIRTHQIDLLVDLSLHMANNRLLTFARKPAPLQITWAGYPGTTGLRSIDYRITDPHLDPITESNAFYSEKSERLPHTFWCYRPMPNTPEVNPLPATSNKYITFGCLNNPTKLTDISLALWAKLLLSVPHSKLLLVTAPGSRRGEIAEMFQQTGIDAGRILFVPPSLPHEHLARYHQIDLSLDPLPYTGHTSTLDSLWMGVPVITLKGQTSLARGSVTALTNLNLPQLIASDESQYISIARDLATNLPRLTQLRSTLRPRMQSSPLCDELQYTRDLEAAYRKIWLQFCTQK
jgi:predicted O-linked N-acetylglucosamine transferase (SPINDLY family)